MKSYYGNLVVDFFELVFAIVSLLLVWVSCYKDSVLFFGITAVVYMLPRFLSVILGIFNNGSDRLRLVIDLISIIMLFVSFMIVCFTMVDYVANIFHKNISTITLSNFFYAVSSVSLIDIVFKLLVGIVQKFSVINRNRKNKSY